mgnify:CR=1 FL=1
MIVEAIFGLFFIIGLIYFVFVRIDEKKEEKFEKRKWWLKYAQNQKVLMGPLVGGDFASAEIA